MSDVNNDIAQRLADKKIPVVEMFGPTLQGEGAMAGVRTTFIRFGLCDYRCTFCDSMHAVDPQRVRDGAEWITQEEILNRLLKLHDPKDQYYLETQWVTFSGGNPCIHNLDELCRRIRGLDITHGNMKIAVETQGTLMPDWLDFCDVITVSPKAPSMEKFELDKFGAFMKRFHKHPGFNIKVVVFNARDLEWAKSINDLAISWGLEDKVYLSQGNELPPGQDSEVSMNDLRIKLMDDHARLIEDLLNEPALTNVKFLPQIHVLTWGNKQGV